ncbi:alpha-L-rhamnosidase C-terminal domain-containing protein [Halococcus sp. IIIV-5B]|uniref:alpha-L-rhamnosidase C-terminal domain-containing protein n=1 Tax=Halococcus sp. IIIV-5B TaxID=2321230 RepID=UPI001F1903DE|nr:alpha-L-rhamnosidase C-terminal domain-containing protein [Halococcus sp. IIIV-5B]
MAGHGSVEVAPALVADLDWAKGSIEIVNGTLASDWTRTDTGYTIDVEVPWNTTATVRLPADVNAASVVEDETTIWTDASEGGTLLDGITAIEDGNSEVVLTVESGSYVFNIEDWPAIQCPADDGRLSIATVITMLWDAGYDGGVTVELIDSLDGVEATNAERWALEVADRLRYLL